MLRKILNLFNAENDIQPALNFKIICLAHVIFEIEIRATRHVQILLTISVFFHVHFLK